MAGLMDVAVALRNTCPSLPRVPELTRGSPATPPRVSGPKSRDCAPPCPRQHVRAVHAASVQASLDTAGR